MWTVTNGLHRYGLPNAIYDSQQPLKGLNNVAAMTGEATSTSARRRRISTMRCGWPSRWHPGGDADAGLSKRVFGRLLAWLQDRKAPVFAVHLRKRKRDPKLFDLAGLAAASDGFSGAEIEQAVIAGLYTAFSRGVEVSSAIIVEELKATKPLSVTRAESIDALREWARDRTVMAS